LTLINTTTINATSVSVNNVFSSAFDNYRITINITLANNNNLLTMRLRDVGNNDATGSNYDQQGIEVIAGTIQNAQGVGTGTSFSLIDTTAGASASGIASTDLFSPFLATSTRHTTIGFSYRNSGQANVTRGGSHTLANSYTGFTLTSSSGLIQGTVTVYGYRKA
jgi:hypothetical protein